MLPNVITPVADSLRAEIAVIGSGPGGAVTAALLAEAGRDVLLIEEGPNLSLNSAAHFSREEIVQKYRNGGITVGMGDANVAYVEGRCVGGGSEINRGLYHRTPPEVLEGWSRQFQVEALTGASLAPHFEACEEIAQVSNLPGKAPAISLKLHQGAVNLGWKSVEVPRLFRYDQEAGTKQSMTETFVPRFLKAGGHMLPAARVRQLARHGGRWHLRTDYHPNGTKGRQLDISADTVFVACGAIQTPTLLRRSGIRRNIGNTLHFHPMVKVVACFPEEVNLPGMVDPVHQVKEFDPRFSMGCSVSSPVALAMAMIDHPEHLAAIDRDWRHMAIYYAQTTGGRGTVRNVPGFDDPLVRTQLTSLEMETLGEALRNLCRCLFAAGAENIYPSVSGISVLKSEADSEVLPVGLRPDQANLQTLHLFSTCPMGQDRSRCATDSFGKLYGADGLYIADASLLCGPTVVNPQGSVMAVAHRNALHFLQHQGHWQFQASRTAPQRQPTASCPSSEEIQNQ